MNKVILSIIFTCACIFTQAQVNYVRNPGFENFRKCPDGPDQIRYCNFWDGIDTSWIPIHGGDTLGSYDCTPEFIHRCSPNEGVPGSGVYYQETHSGDGMADVLMFCDESPPPSPPIENYLRDYLQGHLYKPLKAGTSYCVKFYVSLAESAQYAINHIGAYLNDGHLDTVSHCGWPIPSVTPQVYATSIISDTANWVKIEGDFIANGTETYISIGNFFDKAHTSYVVAPGNPGGQYSYYLVDDVSVIEINLNADAGIDKGVHMGDSTWIGRGLDSTLGLDCKWYKKGMLVDSGAGMWAKGTNIGIDTYVVVQTICGLVKTDTVQVFTFPVGINELPDVEGQSYAIYPNPSSNGNINIIQRLDDARPVEITVYNLQGKVILKTSKQFAGNALALHLDDMPVGLYLMQLTDSKGQSSRLRFVIRK